MVLTRRSSVLRNPVNTMSTLASKVEKRAIDTNTTPLHVENPVNTMSSAPLLENRAINTSITPLQAENRAINSCDCPPATLSSK